MAREEVKITIKKDGSGLMSFDLDGFTGSGCDIIKDIEMAIGNIETTEATAEAFQYDIPDPQFINA